jgi:hypothetical protein
MKVNLLQGISTPKFTPMPGVHKPLHRIAARLRSWMNVKGHGRAAAGERQRYTDGVAVGNGSALYRTEGSEQ